MKHFTRNLNLLDIMPDQPYQELLKNRQDKSLTKNYAWNPSDDDVDTRVFSHFIRFLFIYIQIYNIYYIYIIYIYIHIYIYIYIFVYNITQETKKTELPGTENLKRLGKKKKKMI